MRNLSMLDVMDLTGIRDERQIGWLMPVRLARRGAIHFGRNDVEFHDQATPVYPADEVERWLAEMAASALSRERATCGWAVPGFLGEPYRIGPLNLAADDDL